MGGQVELIKGDMFDGPSDLVVIPCSTIPTVTWFVEDRLRSFGIPEPLREMEPGQIEFAELGRASNIAQVAAYAASVIPPGSSSTDVIAKIGRGLGSYANSNPWIGRIACPLLGTGAGHLDPAESAVSLASGYLSAVPDRANLRLFVLEDFIFSRIKTLLDSQLGQLWPEDSGKVAVADRPLRVFISYARSTSEHAAWVKALATHLRSAGIDARLDVWQLRPGMDVAQWMCNELDMADRVLLICDQLYAQKADGRHGGIGWEIRVIQGDLLQSQQSNPDKFVPIVVTEDITEGMPAFIKAVYCLHWPPARHGDSSMQDELVRIIYRAQEEAPPLGRPPAFVVGRTP